MFYIFFLLCLVAIVEVAVAERLHAAKRDVAAARTAHVTRGLFLVRDDWDGRRRDCRPKELVIDAWTLGQTDDNPVKKESTWTALRNPVFRQLWFASLLSGTCVAAHDTAATWTMNMMATSPLFLSLMSTVASLPFFLFTLLAGALVDTVDRKRLMCVMNIRLAVSASFCEAIRIAKQQKSVSLEKRAEATYAEYRRQKASGSGGRGFRLPIC